MRLLLTLTLVCSLLGATEQINSKAVLASGILPGAGELMLGNRTRGEAFLWLDGVLWLVWGTAYWYGSTQNNNAKIFAVTHAGASINQKANYYDLLEDYDNSDVYNDLVLRDARQRYPDTMAGALEKRQEYLAKHGYFGDAAWNWQPDTLRDGNGVTYREIRRSARTALQRASFAFGSLVLNRLVSVVDCVFFTKENPLSKKIGFVPVDGKPGVMLVYHF
jgi:hypothetical protein